MQVSSRVKPGLKNRENAYQPSFHCSAGQRLGRMKTAWETGNAQVHRALQQRDASEGDARRKVDDLLDALLGPSNLPPDEPSEEEEDRADEAEGDK